MLPQQHAQLHGLQPERHEVPHPGPFIYLDQLDFLGDAVSLFGKGTRTSTSGQPGVLQRGRPQRNSRADHQDFVSQVGQSTMRMYVMALADLNSHPGVSDGQSLIQQIQTDLTRPGRDGQRGNPPRPAPTSR
jgi:hypothetical protein